MALVAALCFGKANAQTPDGQVGIGLTAGNALGGHVAYALNPGFHIGAGVGLALTSRSSGGNSTSGNLLLFAPYAKLILAGMKDMKPYFFGAFVLTSGKGAGETESTTNTGLNFGAGAEYFASRNVGIYGHLSVIRLGFGDVSTTDIGLLEPQVGIEWFFNQ